MFSVNFKLKSVMAAAVLCGSLLSVPALADLKVGVVNYQRLMAESPQAKVATDAIRNEFTPRENELQRLQTSLKNKEEKLTKDGATMSDDQRARAEKELRDGARDLQRRQQELQDDFNARRNEEMGRLQKSLVEEVQAYSKTQAFDLVLADGVIYSTNGLDITPAIITSLQNRKAAPAAKPAGK